jgi:hypothetical protein
MGSYDTVHGGWRCGQTKALGRGLGCVLPGDQVEVIPAPMDAEEYEAYLNGEIQARPERDFLVAMWQGGYLVVRDGIFVKWARSAYPGLPIFDGGGHPFLERPVPAESKAVSVDAGECRACKAVRHGTLDAFRQELAAAALVREEVAAHRRAERARAKFHSV